MSHPFTGASGKGEKTPSPSYTGPARYTLTPRTQRILLVAKWIATFVLAYIAFDTSRSQRKARENEIEGSTWEDLSDSLVAWFQQEPTSTRLAGTSWAAEEAAGGRCPQQDPWKSAEDGIEVTFPETQVLAERLSGGVQIDTSVHDDEPSPQEDPESWKARFSPFRDYLRTTYPGIHADEGPVKLELVNEHGLLYTLQGSDDSLKPLLLMAHQDVVPVDPQTVDDWTYPPFSGAIVNGTVWGRGSTDAKAWLFSILSSIEALIDSGFKPRRTVLISFGYDEEAQGRYGAKYIADRIAERYGNDSLAMIVDEGNPVVPATEPNSLGFPIALPAVEEKGNIHIRVKIEGRGGHSSSPPDRTTIGLLSEFVSSLETGENLRPPVIPDLESAHLKMLHCARLPAVVDKALKDLDAAARSSFEDLRAMSELFSGKYLTLRLLQLSGALTPSSKQRRIAKAEAALLSVLPEDLKLPWSTTQTPTVFHGGIKLNAIPTSAQVEIDHRIALHQTPEGVMQWYKTHLTHFAQKHDLVLYAFGRQVVLPEMWLASAKETMPKVGTVHIEVVSSSAPVPRSPLSGPEAAPWRLFSSVIRSVWSVPADSYTPRGDDSTVLTKGEVPIIVSPSQMRGNTDTRHMLSPLHPLSRHVFRFGPASALPDPKGRSQFAGVHNVDEFFRVEGLERAVRFYADLVRAVDQTREF
ncbi:Zn-dependent exopeptidase [Microstroma glucosiphilum]|uniref:Zn-dependent exopeptidase n=1 Tax=Pseudomicrostroma glucosiphilum TaxID=1684307 RepID=A0A316U0M6_9BASI|nr:Zn-dependent exopeptidase [Pseudomicrostroma glucosiphilum]PWN18969.1 Zn-dependent exopeptidase [Pseudomicrostroma glucosiphilum]